MADNPPPAPTPGSDPLKPLTVTTGRLRAPASTGDAKRGAGKIVVMLSSMAKPPPAVTQPLKMAPAGQIPVPKIVSGDSAKGIVLRPPPLPPKQITTGNVAQNQPRISSTTHVKLPPKTTVPKLIFSGMPAPAEEDAAPIPTVPPPLPKAPEPVKSEARKTPPHLIPPIKLNELSPAENSPSDSIFASAPAPQMAPKPESAKSPEREEPPAAEPQSLEAFQKSEPAVFAPETKAPEAEAIYQMAPPSVVPSAPVEVPTPTQASAPELHPPPLPPVALPPPLPPVAENTATPPALHVAPPMLEKAPEPSYEKLAQPHLPPEIRKEEALSDVPELPPVHHAPAMIGSDAAPAKALPQPVSKPAKQPANWAKKQSTPIVVSSTSPKAPVPVPKIAETKPALKPPTLPKRSFLSPTAPPDEDSSLPITPLTVSEAAKLEAKPDESAIANPLPAVVAPAPEVASPSLEKKEQVSRPAVSIPIAPVTPLQPTTRAARAKKRRLWDTVAFYVFFAVAMVVLYFGALHVLQETSVEGQVIPPPATTLNNEVWIVSGADVWSQAQGIADDLAKERAPLMQEIQERQDHVQRVQADIAAREERIRIINQEMQAAKADITATVKQSRDATQQIWDTEGAAIDDEYQSHLNQLRKAIADRAKSLNLKYQPDDTYQSPEVWANAYRLALYDVPASVDSVKEHAWLGDQMKQWRDLLKSLDDRKEQLREKAAQLKLAPAPKITDLNSKIDDLQQRSDSTAAEEVPLKAELLQAQADLTAAQAAEVGLDDKYYKELNSLPQASITTRIPLATDGRFTWIENDPFVEGEREHRYWIFSRATRTDGRQYWALGHFAVEKDHKICLLMEPESFISTKAILRPDLSSDEQAQ
jgi:hypothetical protein